MGQKKLWPDPKTDTLAFEKDLQLKGYQNVAGLDEVGRGPLAGPVVAACVVLPSKCEHSVFVDSKKINHITRQRLFEELQSIGAVIGVGVVSEREIEQLNILTASLFAMEKAINSSNICPDYLLVDGNQPVPTSLPQQTLIKGESKSASIGAASIVAKVFRDKLMENYHHLFPVYNFIKNKGYPTLEHREAIKQHGPCTIHRQTFKGVREFVTQSFQDDCQQDQQGFRLFSQF